MCGFAGFLDPGGARSPEWLAETARTMATTLRHRGPDDEGVWVDAAAGVALGHRRLAVLDLSAAGHQPMRSRDGRFVLVYNGEVYNHRELARRLEAGGVRLRGHSDTEVVVEAFAAWGVETALRLFNGMFALAAWDRGERRLWLARDRMGEKPLYYAEQAGRFLFASELKALRAHPQFTAELDAAAASELLTYNFIPGPRSILRGVAKLRPGHVLVAAGAGAASVAPRPFWSLAAAIEAGRADPLPGAGAAAEAGAVARVSELLADAVRLRLESDVPLGALLSGGIDSSLVVALMQRHSAARVRTFSVGFDRPGYDESAHARRVAEHLGTEHRELRVSPADALELVPRLPALYDEPFADSSQIPTHLIARLAREHVTVVLTGDGGDELFAGYHRYAWGERLRRGMERIPPAARRRLGALATAVPPARLDALARAAYPWLPPAWRFSTPGDRVHKLAAAFAATSAASLYDILLGNGSGHAAPAAGPAPSLAAGSRGPPLADLVDRMRALDMLVYLPDDVLVKVDRATMAVGLESRAPFLDHRLVELCWRIPHRLHLRGGAGKRLTRRILGEHVPPAVWDRPKTGFAVPLDDWLRGPLRAWAEEYLRPARLAESGVVDADHVRRRWAEHQSGARSWAHFLWSVLMFEAWREAHGVG